MVVDRQLRCGNHRRTFFKPDGLVISFQTQSCSHYFTDDGRMVGNKLFGVLATLWDNYTNKANYFWLNFALLMAAAAMCFMMLKWLNKIMKEKGVK